MSKCWTVGLVTAAILCCAAPFLIGAGIVGAAWALAREHWSWLAVGLGLAGLAVLAIVIGVQRAREP